MKKAIIVLLCIVSGFSAIAQSVCDSISIKDVRYDPFYDSVIRVSAYNHSETFINYPQFSLYTGTGSIVAKETMNLFGMVQESRHLLDIKFGRQVQNSFHGFLLLESIDSMICTFERDFKLCPDTCQMIYPFIGHFGPSGITGNLTWTIEKIENHAMQVVASGQFVLDINNSTDRDSICLTPGTYTMKVNGAVMSAENPLFGISTDDASYFITPYNTASLELPFSFFKKCTGPTGILVKNKTEDYNVYATGQTVRIATTATLPAHVSIYAADGRSVYNASITSQNMSVDMSHTPPGIYFVRIAGKDEMTVVKKILIGAY